MLKDLRLFALLVALPAVAQVPYGAIGNGKYLRPTVSVGTGLATLGLSVKNSNNVVLPLSTAFKVAYYVDNVLVSGAVPYGTAPTPYAFSYNTALLPDGAHAACVELLSAPATDPAINYRSKCATVITVNGNPASTLGMPTYGSDYITNQFSTPVADFVQMLGTTRPQFTPNPGVIDNRVIPPANGVYQPVTAFETRRPLGLESELYRPDPQVVLKNGVPIVGYYSSLHFNSTVPFPTSGSKYLTETYYDGPPGHGRISPLSTWRPVPQGPGVYNIDGAMGRLTKMSWSGDVTTIVGRRSDPLMLGNERDASATYSTVGTFVGGTLFKSPHDLCVDPRDNNIIYIADTYNHRIAMVNVATQTVTTFAGKVGVESKIDGDISVATFHYPSSCEMMDDGTMYVSQFGEIVNGSWVNYGIRKISPDGLTVSSLPWGSVPFVIRKTSTGTLVIGHKNTGVVSELDPVTGTRRDIVSLIGRTWQWLDVDRFGTIGPVDRIYYVTSVGDAPGQYHNQYLYHIDLAYPVSGSAAPGFTQPLQPSGDESQGDAEKVDIGHYMWAAVPDDEEGRFLSAGYGSQSPYLTSLGRTGTKEFYLDMFTTGNSILISGSVKNTYSTASGSKTPFDWPFGMRPSLTGLYGGAGNHTLPILTFDEIMSMPLADRLNYYKAGMGGSIPRPELTGIHARALDYFICKCSYKAFLGSCVPGPAPSDTTPPVISNVVVTRTTVDSATITWDTNKPTIGFVAFANAGASASQKHRWSRPETGYTMLGHSVTIPFLEGQVNLQALAKDDAGNSAWSSNIVSNAPVTDTTPPTVSIAALPSFVSGTVAVNMTATDNVGVVKVELYGNSTLLGSSLVAPYSVSVNTNLLSGAVSFSARAYDAAGNVGISTLVNVTVDNAPPTVAITSPGADAFLSGTVPVNITASDNIAVTKVELYANGVLVGTPTSVPYSVSVDTTTLSGAVAFTAKAYDAAGNIATSAPVNVTVLNFADN